MRSQLLIFSVQIYVGREESRMLHGVRCEGNASVPQSGRTACTQYVQDHRTGEFKKQIVATTHSGALRHPAGLRAEIVIMSCKCLCKSFNSMAMQCCKKTSFLA